MTFMSGKQKVFYSASKIGRRRIGKFCHVILAYTIAAITGNVIANEILILNVIRDFLLSAAS